MKNTVFRGVGTALITPFSSDKIDFAVLERLIEMQVSAGVGALVIGGTTGEAAVLDDSERYDLYRAAHEAVDGRTKLILGTGTNDTRVAIKHTEMAEKIGCDGVLLVTPYYNKGTEEGLFRHYREIINSTSLAAILYNVPSRTGVNLSLDLVRRLAELEGVVGIKEASGSADRLAELSAIDGLDLYAGNDAETYQVMALGGRGVISVVSNLYPSDMVRLCRLCDEGKYDEARRLQSKLLPLIKALFLETNPAPIKYAMWRAGYSLPDMRLPMWVPTRATREKVDRAMDEYGRKRVENG